MLGSDFLEQALAGGSPQRVGWFRFYFADERWEWSEQVQLMHGYEPGTVTPTTRSWCCPTNIQTTTFRSRHPWTRSGAATGHLAPATASSTPEQVVHDVVVIGDRSTTTTASVVGTHGFYVDVTPTERAREDLVNAAVAEIAENRATIEQAKGMLMLIYRIDDDSAFELMKWRSQETNVKLRILADQVLCRLRAADLRGDPAAAGHVRPPTADRASNGCGTTAAARTAS